MRRLIPWALLASLTLTGPAWSQAAPATSSTSQVEAVAKRYVAQGTVPGIVAAIGRGDAPPMVVAEGRIANEPTAASADIDSLWRVYSMTKPITGIAAMILVEEGKLKLDQPISDFIPGFKSMRVLVDPAKDLTTRPAARPITVRNLLTHTAGFGYHILTRGPLLGEYNRLGIHPAAVSAPMEVSERKVRPATLAEFADRVATLPLLSDPGARWRYSIALDVLGRVIEVAGGLPFDRFVQTRILTPLKMTSSYWTVPGSQVKRFATNYALLGRNRVALDPAATSAWLQPPSFPYGGAGLVMSARDYDRFLHMLLRQGELDGVRILKAETARLAMSDLLPVGVDKRELRDMTRTGVPTGFGAGGSVSLADVPNGPGKGTYGWGGAAGTIAFVDPVRKLRATVMINVIGDPPLRADITPAIYATLR